MTRQQRERRTLFAGGQTAVQSRRAILIAQDVLRWMRTRKLTIETGSYLVFEEDPAPGTPLQPILRKLATAKRPCEVCALGACLIAKIDRFNAVEMPVTFGRSVTAEALSDIFSNTQMDLIEAAFEVTSEYAIFDGVQDAIAFGQRFNTNPRLRLRRIMQNIIEHKGVFVPPPAPQTELEAA